MLFERGNVFWRAALLDVVLRGVGMKMHGEETPLDEVTLRRLAQPDGDIRLAHGQIELFIRQQHLQAYVGIKIEKLANARR